MPIKETKLSLFSNIIFDIFFFLYVLFVHQQVQKILIDATYIFQISYGIFALIFLEIVGLVFLTSVRRKHQFPLRRVSNILILFIFIARVFVTYLLVKLAFQKLGYFLEIENNLSLWILLGSFIKEILVMVVLINPKFLDIHENKYTKRIIFFILGKIFVFLLFCFLYTYIQKDILEKVTWGILHIIGKDAPLFKWIGEACIILGYLFFIYVPFRIAFIADSIQTRIYRWVMLSILLHSMMISSLSTFLTK